MTKQIKITIPLIWVFCFVSLISFSQSKAELEKKRIEKEKQIELTKKLLEETSEKQKETLGYLSTLNSQISNRLELIITIKKELKYLDESITDNEDIINSLEKDIENLKDEYAEMLRFAYKNRNTYNKLGFILSAKTFNQSFKRLKLLQSYTDYRKNQLSLIYETKASLEQKLGLLNDQKNSKLKLLKKQSEEKQKLESDKQKQAKISSVLAGKQDELKKQLAEQKKASDALKKQIAAIIEKEMAKKSNAYYLTPAAQKLSMNFASNRGKLPWPVDRGFISESYGKKEVEGLHNVYVINNGIKFKTVKGAQARSVFDGTVKNVINIPGSGKSVLINHGSYFTVYSNLDEVFVNPGDQVTTKQSIGTIRYNSKNASTELELQIWKLKEHQNPSYWLLSR